MGFVSGRTRRFVCELSVVCVCDLSMVCGCELSVVCGCVIECGMWVGV